MSFLDDFVADMTRAKRPSIERKPWMNATVMTLVTVETISAVIDECIAAGLYALDLETTGLDNRVYSGRTVDQIVGACLSPDGVRGYYIPVRHTEHLDKCVPVTLFEAEMRRLVQSPAVAIFHNGKFDQEFLSYCGGDGLGAWDSAAKWDDTIILKYMQDAKAKSKGLKTLAKVELDCEMIELDELFTEEELQKYGHNFAVLDPSWEPAIWYACSDAICTYRLYKKLKDPALLPTDTGLGSQLNVYNMEKACVPATRWMERCRIPIHVETVEELIRVGQREWFPALREVYEACSKVLGRDITPGYFKILADKSSPYRFDPDDISCGIMERVQRARAEAESRKIDPTEIGDDGHPRRATIQRTVPKLAAKPGVKPTGVEDVLFPQVYDVLLPDELGLLLRELGVQGLQLTDKGEQIKTSKEVLDEVLNEAGAEFPYLAKVKKFREIAKALSSNLMPIYEVVRDDVPRPPGTPVTGPNTKCPDGRDGIRRIRINFEAWRVDTGRFSTPQDREGRGWTGKTNWNLHSIPSTREGKGSNALDEGRPECMKRIREIIRAEPGRYIVAIDFSGQELRLITNMSGEPLWQAEFFRCSGCNHQFDRGAVTPPPPEPPPPFCPKCGSDKIGDLHSLTAINVFGEHITQDKKVFKDKRGIAKNINFGLSYGGGPSAIMRVTGCSKDEAFRIKRQFDNSYKTLQGWWKKQHEFARRTGHVVTAFGRRCPLPDIHSEMGGFRAKAERNAVNAPIQGGGADLMKYSMALIYKEFRDRGWLDKARMILTIHDELVFEVEREILAEMIAVATEIMLRRTTARLPWRVPLTADVEVGQDWTVPWNIVHIQYGKEEMPAELEGLIQVGVPNRPEPPAPAPTASNTPPIDHTPNTPREDSASPEQSPPEVQEEEQLASDPPPPPEPRAAPSGFVEERIGEVVGTPEPVAQARNTPPPPRTQAGEPFVFKIERQSLSVSTATKLAKTIALCRGKGTNLLRIELSDTGESLWDGEDVYVDGAAFHYLYRYIEGG